MAEVDADLLVAHDVVIPARELSWRFSRSGGPGGQHVNTTDSRVELAWGFEMSTALTDVQRSRLRRAVDADVVSVTVSEHRSQLRNRAIARERLATVVAEAIAPPPPPRRATKPTRAAQRRRLESKMRRGETKRLRQRPGSAD